MQPTGYTDIADPLTCRVQFIRYVPKPTAQHVHVVHTDVTPFTQSVPWAIQQLL